MFKVKFEIQSDLPQDKAIERISSSVTRGAPSFGFRAGVVSHEEAQKLRSEDVSLHTGLKLRFQSNDNLFRGIITNNQFQIARNRFYKGSSLLSRISAPVLLTGSIGPSSTGSLITVEAQIPIWHLIGVAFLVFYMFRNNNRYVPPSLVTGELIFGIGISSILLTWTIVSFCQELKRSQKLLRGILNTSEIAH